MPKSGRVCLNQSVSFPPELLARAKKRARNLGLTFSAYVQKCVERDLTERKPIVFQEAEEPALLVADDAASLHPQPRRRRSRR